MMYSSDRTSRETQAWETDLELHDARLKVSRLENKLRILSLSCKDPRVAKDLPSHFSKEIPFECPIKDIFRCFPLELLNEISISISMDSPREGLIEIKFLNTNTELTWIIYKDTFFWPGCHVLVFYRDLNGKIVEHYVSLVPRLVQLTTEILKFSITKEIANETNPPT